MPNTKSQNRVKKDTPKPKSSIKRIAPVAESFAEMRPKFETSRPRKGGCAAYKGIDYVGSISSATTAFNDIWKVLYLAPDEPAPAFPRLTAIASVFRKYYFHKMRFHLIGRSASTQKGNMGFAVLMGNQDLTVLNEVIIKNTESCAVVRGWESRTCDALVEATALKWLDVNASDSIDYSFGAALVTIPATAAAGDLQWDVYVEYDVEFDQAVTPAINDPLFRKSEQPVRTQHSHKETVEALRLKLEALTRG